MVALKALLAQAGGLALLLVIAQGGWLAELPLLSIAFLQGAAAAFFSAGLKSARWWLPIHFCFMPAIVLATENPLPPWLYATAFIVLSLIYWSSFRTQVPLFLSNKQTVHQLAKSLPALASMSVLDVGSGTGNFVRRLALLRPDWRIAGVESAPAPYLLSRYMSRQQGNVSLSREDFWRMSLTGFDVVYAFLSPVPMPALWAKAVREMRPGSLLISNSFAVPGIEPERIVLVEDSRQTRLHFYRIPGRATKPR